MDSILKYVQGDYIRSFGENIKFLMSVVFQRARQPKYEVQ